MSHDDGVDDMTFVFLMCLFCLPLGLFLLFLQLCFGRK
jgi:hypothetical protein